MRKLYVDQYHPATVTDGTIAVPLCEGVIARLGILFLALIRRSPQILTQSALLEVIPTIEAISRSSCNSDDETRRAIIGACIEELPNYYSAVQNHAARLELVRAASVGNYQSVELLRPVRQDVCELLQASQAVNDVANRPG